MQSKIFSVCLMMAALIAGPVHARSTPLINVENAPVVTGSGQPATLAQIKQAVTVAGAAQNWQVTEAGNGKLVASLTVRGKHFMTVDIPYSATQYSILYKSSVNLNYDAMDGVPSIHPNYNKWVQTLSNNIRVELLKL